MVAVISGGGSTLLCQPNNFTCVEEAELLQHLFKEGATIGEINTVRKHLSLARGGHLARYAYPAMVVGLIFSDIPGNDLSLVASGPTFLDTSTKSEAAEVLNRYHKGQTNQLSTDNLLETPKEKKYFSRVNNFLAVSNLTALRAMAAVAETNNFSATICDLCLAGEARIVGQNLVAQIMQQPPRTAFLYGGETTVKISGAGQGGRNQELALAALPAILENTLLISLASDGQDNSDHAGAICDIITKRNAEKLNLKSELFLAENNSYEFFRQTSDYLSTGPTGANVSDLLLVLKK